MNTEIINRHAFFVLMRTGLWGTNDCFIYDDKFFDSVEWEKVFLMAQEQSVVGLLTAGLEYVTDLRIPQNIALKFAGVSLQIERKNEGMNAFICELWERFRKHSVYSVLVKGQGVAQCYHRPLWRSCGDVDLLLSDENYRKAKELLVPLATEVETEYEGSKHLGLTIDGWVLELHGSLRVGLPRRINRVLDDIQVDTFYNGDVRSWLNGQTQVFMLGKENDIVYVFVHFFNHFYKEGVGLRQICDWCRLMWTYRNEIDVKKIEGLVMRMGLVTEWRAFYNLASRYLGMPDLGSDLMAYDSRFDKKADRIIEFVLKSGNMGHNRDMSHFSKYPYLIRKCVSMGRRISDLINHARIFPLDSLRFFPRIMFNGLRSAIKGE